MGEKQRIRLCDSPKAAQGGLECRMSDDGDNDRGTKQVETTECKEGNCPGNALLPLAILIFVWLKITSSVY